MRFIVASTLLAAAVVAQAPTSAPACATSCLQTKISEAASLAPGVNPSNLAGLCMVPNFVQAFVNCATDNCPSTYLASIQHPPGTSSI